MGTRGAGPIADFLLTELANHLTTAQHELHLHLRLYVVCG
jgi:hypothetical protein